MNPADMRKLADLARLDIPDAELSAVAGEFGAILAYVDQVRSVELPAAEKTALGETKNRMREDGAPHAGRAHTARLVGAMPASENGYLKVKRIL